ncbi:FHA domain-containing protein [Kocuria sp. CPCC 205300]|uniref:FHA domain-containing protein n=1 Tax=Kocuria sabuli TaxID=3071448 RepID=UPI0036DAE2EA
MSDAEAIRVNGSQGHDGPHFFVLDPDGNRVRRVDVPDTPMVFGRAVNSDVVLDSPDVSRRHALVRRHGEDVVVQDLGSTSGTRLNGTTVTSSFRLKSGDLLELASVRIEYENRSGSTATGPSAAPTRVQPQVGTGARYDVESQRAETISNVGGSQYNSQVTQILRERNSLLRDVASTKTKAGWLILCGFVLFLGGFALFGASIIEFMTRIIDSFETGMEPSTDDLFGEEMLGVPSGLIGWAAAAAGTIMMAVGLVLHVIAASRRKQIYRDFPVDGREGT